MKIPSRVRISTEAPVVGGKADLSRLARELQQWNRTIQETIAGNTKSGTFVVDDGTSRFTLTFTEGRLTGVTSAASTGAPWAWTDS